MERLSCLDDLDDPLVLDSSVLINLNATGCAEEILRALANPVIVVREVLAELDEGTPKGRVDAALLNRFIDRHLVTLGELEESAEAIFEGLIVGPATKTLDDGEAATIAHAVNMGVVALFDERKAHRIAANRFPKLRVACTGDILAHRRIQKALGREKLAVATYNALTVARMRVLPRHMNWVIALIGAEKARLCTSLPYLARFPRTPT